MKELKRTYVIPSVRVVNLMGHGVFMDDATLSIHGEYDDDDSPKVKAYNDDLNEEWSMTSTPVQNGNGVWDKAW